VTSSACAWLWYHGEEKIVLVSRHAVCAKRADGAKPARGAAVGMPRFLHPRLDPSASVSCIQDSVNTLVTRLSLRIMRILAYKSPCWTMHHDSLYGPCGCGSLRTSLRVWPRRFYLWAIRILAYHQSIKYCALQFFCTSVTLKRRDIRKKSTK